MGNPGLFQEGPDVSALLPERGDNREQTAAAERSFARLDAMADLAVDHRLPQRSLSGVVGGFDALNLQKRLSSDIRFWSSGDTKTGPPDALLMEALRRPLDRCFIGGCRVVGVGCGIRAV